MTEQYFFTCSIGPVQGFVATARTSQDLWFGSWMLSELAKAAAKALKDGEHILIFPAPESDLSHGSAVNVANKVVALINGDSKVVGDAVWTAVEARRDELAKISFDVAEEKGKFDRAFAEKQLADLIEFYWAASPYDSNNYADARKRAEALFNARKNTRNFQQVHGKDGLPKSSLDGFRESVLPKEPQKGFPFWRFKADKGESLSGIDLLKRWGKRPDDEKFLSTTDRAAKPFEIYLDTRRDPLLSEIKSLLAEYTPRTETDGTYFYVDRLVQLIDDEQKAANFREAFAGLFRERKVDRQPSPYYALLQADGDNMGKMIDAQKTREQHSELSNKLSLFATQAKEIIEKHDGVLVYVGGDDVLAYLPLHTALKCVKALDEEFSKFMQGFVSEDDISPTLSVGLVIAHHLTPLSDVLEQARNAEKKAKQVNGKNGLVISLSKRGSAERVVKGKLAELTERMEQLIDMTLQKAISHGAAYELEALQQRLNIPDLDKDILRKEALRIIGRKWESGGEEKVKQETRKTLEGLAQAVALDELAGEMIVAAELTKACDMAYPKEKTP